MHIYVFFSPPFLKAVVDVLSGQGFRSQLGYLHKVFLAHEECMSVFKVFTFLRFSSFTKGLPDPPCSCSIVRFEEKIILNVIEN